MLKIVLPIKLYTPVENQAITYFIGGYGVLMKHLTRNEGIFGWFHPHTIGMGCVLDVVRGY